MITKEQYLINNPNIAKLGRVEQSKAYDQFVDNVLWSSKENDPIGNAYFGSDFMDSKVVPVEDGNVIGGGSPG